MLTYTRLYACTTEAQIFSKFIYVAGHHLFPRPIHPFGDGFSAAPICLQAIGVGPVDWINELAAVIHHQERVVTGAIGYGCISYPLVRYNNRTGSHNPFNDG